MTSQKRPSSQPGSRSHHSILFFRCSQASKFTHRPPSQPLRCREEVWLASVPEFPPRDHGTPARRLAGGFAAGSTKATVEYLNLVCCGRPRLAARGGAGPPRAQPAPHRAARAQIKCGGWRPGAPRVRGPVALGSGRRQQHVLMAGGGGGGPAAAALAPASAAAAKASRRACAAPAVSSGAVWQQLVALARPRMPGCKSHSLERRLRRRGAHALAPLIMACLPHLPAAPTATQRCARGRAPGGGAPAVAAVLLALLAAVPLARALITCPGNCANCAADMTCATCDSGFIRAAGGLSCSGESCFPTSAVVKAAFAASPARPSFDCNSWHAKPSARAPGYACR